MIIKRGGRSVRFRQRVKRPLVKKSLRRHFRLTVKPRYLGKNASQIKSYHGTLSESHARSFRIRHKKSPDALPGLITISSYPVGNKTS